MSGNLSDALSEMSWAVNTREHSKIRLPEARGAVIMYTPNLRFRLAMPSCIRAVVLGSRM